MSTNVWNKRGRGRGYSAAQTQQQTNQSNDKFMLAQATMQESVQKHLAKEQLDSSSEDEEIDRDPVLKQLLQNYSRLGGSLDDLGRTREYLENLFESNAIDCLICISSVKRTESVWSCSNCYGVFHLSCISKWSKDSLFQQTQAVDTVYPEHKTIILTWPCPKCRHQYSKDNRPSEYYCFCGKVEDPPVHPWVLPHTCGDTCDKLLVPECGHKCLLLCHPGPCPPCPKTVTTSCHCGKSVCKARCGNNKWSCGVQCGRKLPCNKHVCKDACHDGECELCPEVSLQSCNCRRQTVLRPCSVPNWQCDQVCGKPYSCGNHKCELVCHSGQCGPCPLTLDRTCPCGQSSSVLPCNEEVPACFNTCSKMLDCNFHQCQQKCHKDKCGQCLELIVKPCRCGSHKKQLPCSKEYLCEKKCKEIRDCLNHYCNRKCCDGQCPPCVKPCGRTLPCGTHKCSSVCHRGPCFPCQQVSLVKCNCGGTVLTVPCGAKRRTRPPKCYKSCRIPPDCHHTSRDFHYCHFGECPGCKQVCNKTLDKCGHLCSSRCHQGRQVLPCPDCTYTSNNITCAGGHEMTTCSNSNKSCGRACGRMLSCGNHTCQLPCHRVEGAVSEQLAGVSCDQCNLGCVKPRPIGCTHTCRKPCHSSPCDPCLVINKIKCHCQLNILYIRCSELTTADESARSVVLSCGNQCSRNFECGHRCPENCHPEPCTGSQLCKKKMRVQCPCGRIKKDFTCDVNRSGGAAVACDDKCQLKKDKVRKAVEEEERKKKEEEEKRNKEEVDKFEKKLQGRKRGRERNRMKESDEKSTWRTKIIVTSVLFALVGVVYYLFK